MKFTESLLFFMASLVVGAQSITITFPGKVLQPDLHEILMYNQKSDNVLPALINWPQSITFTVHQEPTNFAETILKVDGLFKLKKLFSSTYNGLYYSQNGTFYFKTKKGREIAVVPDKLITYTPQPRSEIAVPYLSIRYFSLGEIQHNIKLYYAQNKLHFDNVLYENPATFLVTMPNFEGHFLEYTFQSIDPYPKAADGVLQVLTGVGTAKQVKLRDNKQAHRLVFDQKTQILSIPESLNIHSVPTRHVFGVRMATTGCLTEVQKSRVKMLNSHDLIVGDGIPGHHRMPREYLLEKIKVVEPRLNYNNVKFSLHQVPKEARFQVQGNILIKKINFLASGLVDQHCPILIEYEQNGEAFDLGGQPAVKLCTDEIQLWVYE